MPNPCKNTPIELILPADPKLMLVIRLTVAGVIARAGVTVDRMDDMKLAVEEACSCLIGAEHAPERLTLKFSEDEQGLKINVCGNCDCRGASLGEDERSVVKCILESLVDGVELCMHGEAIGAIEMHVALER